MNDQFEKLKKLFPFVWGLGLIVWLLIIASPFTAYVEALPKLILAIGLIIGFFVGLNQLGHKFALPRLFIVLLILISSQPAMTQVIMEKGEWDKTNEDVKNGLWVKSKKMSDSEFARICDSLSQTRRRWIIIENYFYAGAQTGILNERIYAGGVYNAYGGITLPIKNNESATGVWYGIDFSYRRNFTRDQRTANDYYSVSASLKLDAGIKTLCGRSLDEAVPFRPALMVLFGLRRGEKTGLFFAIRVFFGEETGHGWTFTWEGLGDQTGPKAMVGKQWQF